MFNKREGKAFGGLLSAVRRAIKVGKPVELRKVLGKAADESGKLEMKLARIEEEAGIDAFMRRHVGDMSEEYPNINFSDARLTDEDVIASLSPAKAREFKKLTKQMEQADDAYEQIKDRLVEIGEDPWFYPEGVDESIKTPTGSRGLQDARRETYQAYNKSVRTRKQEGGELDAQMADMMKEPTHTMPDGTEMPGATHEEYAGSMAEEPMVPDETMEEDFVDYVVESTLEPEDINYLEEALATDDRLSMIFDQIVETASEFSGSGPVEGPGTEMSDSIPARLSDGEFVITSKATDKIGSDNLQGMMEQAELEADMDEVKRQVKAIGGEIQSEVEKVSSTVVEEDPIRLKNKEAMRALDPRLSLFAS